MARAARLVNLVSLVRVFSAEDWVIERYLGRGVDGIVVPRLETAEQAAEVVNSVRYCYPGTLDAKIIVVQIETKSALEMLDDMLRIDGIDAYFVGPVDLAKSLGYKGDFRRPEVQEAMDKAIESIRQAGKVAGILVDRDNVRTYVERGVQFLYGHANDLIVCGAKEFSGRISGH